MRLQAMLHKTIVFITHDFDEAVRLATRIAIMREGRIVQLAQPEELIVMPADDYVARFTAKVSFADVIRVRTIMREGNAASDEAPIPANALVRDVATRILDAGRPICVSDENGRIVGAVAPSAVVDVLARRWSGASR